MNNSDVLLNQAIQLSKQSDLVLAFVGDSLATCEESWGGRTGDRADLDLAGGQLHLIEALLQLGKPLVLILINGRPATFGTITMVICSF